MPDPNPSDDPVVVAMTSLADHFEGLLVDHGNGVTEDVAGSIRATLTAATTIATTATRDKIRTAIAPVVDVAYRDRAAWIGLTDRITDAAVAGLLAGAVAADGGDDDA